MFGVCARMHEIGSQCYLLSDIGQEEHSGRILWGIPEKEDEEEGIWLVLYDFKSKSNPRFWANIRRLVGLVGEGSLV